MNKQQKRIIALLLTVATIFSIAIPVAATNSTQEATLRASNYITSVWAGAYGGNGQITVDFSITATGKMTSLGATSIIIKNSSGDTVKTFLYSTTPTMMGTNLIYYSHSVTYFDATPGKKYYAIVCYKAANRSGSDTTSYTTDYATA